MIPLRDDRPVGASSSLKGIALLTEVPGLSFQVINITKVFVDRRPLRRRDRLLPVPDRPLPGGAGPRAGRGHDALREAIVQVGAALVASAGTVIVGLGMLYFSSFAKIQYTGPAIALSLTVALRRRPHAGPGAPLLAAGGDLLAVPPAPPRHGGRPGAGEPRADPA